jgi:hypothetical protein
MLGSLTDIFELVISGPFTSSLQFFRFDSENVVAVTVPERYMNVALRADFVSANDS